MTDTFQPRFATSAPSRVHRDSSIDAIRVVLLVAVFALHAMMVGVSLGPDGPILQNALDGQAWFGPVSWIVQIMPLFFIAGGFSSYRHWQSMRGRGASSSEYVRARLERLVRPAIALVVVVAVALIALAMSGMPADVVATAGFRIGQPLWFLGVYVATSALVPLLVLAHERARVLTPMALLAGVVSVDVVRMATGIEAIGFVNLLLVWLLVQQLGFWLADGGIDRVRRSTLGAVAAGSLAFLAVLTVIGPYDVDMFENLNPPTVCLVVLGIAQLALFLLVRPRLRALADTPDASRLVSAVGERAMTIYLWHMPVLIALAGASLVAESTLGVPLPEPLSVGWWATRPIWLTVAAVAVVPVALAMGRFERGSRGPAGRCLALPRGRSTVVDAACAVAGVAVLLVAGFGPLPALIALALLVVALRGSGALFRGLTTSVSESVSPSTKRSRSGAQTVTVR